MEISNFKDMYLAELQELVSVEEQLSEALLRMAASITSHPALKDALVDHQAETIAAEGPPCRPSFTNMAPTRRRMSIRPCRP